MFCEECGRKMPNDSLFCPECGAKQDAEPDVKPVKMVNAASPRNVGNNREPLKYCGNCKCEIPMDSRFCPECRAPQEDAAPNQRPKVQPAGPAAPAPLSQEEVARVAKRNKMITAVVGGALALCLIIGIASVIIKPTIKLNNYLAVTFEGYDTVGKALVTFDTEKFEEDYGKKLGGNSSKTKLFLSKCTNGYLDVNSGLSNGDIVTYIWDCDDDYALKNFDYKLKYKNIEYTVSDLEEAKTFDPFEGIEVIFDGISPDGSAGISGKPSDAAAQELRYQLDTYSGLQNGDIVTVTASVRYSDDPIEYCISNYGKIPSELEKKFTVEGLNSYIRSLDAVSSASLEEMQTQAEDVYNAKAAQKWGDDEKLRSFTYLGSYLLTNKSNKSRGSSDNILYLVYKVQVQNEYTNNEEIYNETNDIYWYIAYYDLLVDPSGVTTVNVTNYKTPSDRFTIDSGIRIGWRSPKSWNYYGYQTLDELYKVVVTSNAESYKHVGDVDESLAVSEVTEEEAETAVEAETVGEDGIIFPNSSEELLNESDIEECSDEELRYAVNELYARHGYIFKDDMLREYYNQFAWYEEKVESDDFEMDLFNDIENENIKMLQKVRDSRN